MRSAFNQCPKYMQHDQEENHRKCEFRCKMSGYFSSKGLGPKGLSDLIVIFCTAGKISQTLKKLKI